MAYRAIDPGPKQSAWVLMEGEHLHDFGIWENCKLYDALSDAKDLPLAIEMIASYGMAVGKDVFETCTWIGKFETRAKVATRIYRKDVKMNLCHTMKAKDSNIRQALIDRYGPSKDVAIGNKANPGPLYGVSKDVWAALGVAITYYDKFARNSPNG